MLEALQIEKEDCMDRLHKVQKELQLIEDFEKRTEEEIENL